jgi:uncharacterized DUF497 family protein
VARLKVEWDERKRRHNIRKHGLDFRTACRIFEHDHIELYDEEHSADEDRFIALGQVDGRVVKVVFTVREGARRLISAFDAGDEETKDFYDWLFGG